MLKKNGSVAHPNNLRLVEFSGLDNLILIDAKTFFHGFFTPWPTLGGADGYLGEVIHHKTVELCPENVFGRVT
jgi:hypothetical protein